MKELESQIYLMMHEKGEDETHAWLLTTLDAYWGCFYKAAQRVRMGVVSPDELDGIEDRRERGYVMQIQNHSESAARIRMGYEENHSWFLFYHARLRETQAKHKAQQKVEAPP